MLEDIAILTGGTVITEDLGLDLKDANMTALGQAAKELLIKIAQLLLKELVRLQLSLIVSM